MPYTVTNLINDAYYLSGVVARDLQTVSGSQTTDGLNSLNEILSVEGITGMTIPYYKEYELDAVINQELYFIPGLIELENFTFNIGSVRYSAVPQKRNKFFGDARVDGINSLPLTYHIERTLNGTNLYLYFVPGAAYPMKIWGKFGLDELDPTTDLCTDLLTVYERSYTTYLKYKLTEYICEGYSITVPEGVAARLSSLEAKLTYMSPKDYSARTVQMFGNDASLNYGFINLYQGIT